MATETEFTTTRTSEVPKAVTLEVDTPDRFYDASAKTITPDTSKAAATKAPAPAAEAKKESNGSVCQHCGVSGPVDSSRCFPNNAKDLKEHKFLVPGMHDDKEDTKPERTFKTLRWFWKVWLVVIFLACYGVAIAYIVIPIQKYLNQDVATAVTVKSATKDTPIPFPGIQICNFNWNANIRNFQAYYEDPLTNTFSEVNATITPMDDYGYDTFNCYELNNGDPSKNLQASSKRQKYIIAVRVPIPTGKPAVNTDCFPHVCDPELPDNEPIRDSDPINDAMGISIAAFAPTGIRRPRVEDDVTYLTAGAYSQVSLTYYRTFRYQVDTPEENYTIRTSSVRYVPNAYAINFTADGDSFEMDEVVFAEISFGELAFTEVNETKPYEPFNAFGDATAIVGFFTGFGFFGGPTFLPLIMDHSANGLWAKVFYTA